MAKSRREVALKKCEQIEFEMKFRRKAEERLRRRRRAPMTKGEFRYWVMRDSRLLEGYHEGVK